jgi:hypothetical protein
MASSGTLRRVALVRTDVSEEPSASFIRVTRIGELGTTLKNGVFWDVTPCGSILHSHRRENLKSYIGTTLAVTTDARCEELPLFLRRVRRLLQLALFLVHRFLSP